MLRKLGRGPKVAQFPIIDNASGVIKPGERRASRTAGVPAVRGDECSHCPGEQGVVLLVQRLHWLLAGTPDAAVPGSELVPPPAPGHPGASPSRRVHHPAGPSRQRQDNVFADIGRSQQEGPQPEGKGRAWRLASMAAGRGADAVPPVSEPCTSCSCSPKLPPVPVGTACNVGGGSSLAIPAPNRLPFPLPTSRCGPRSSATTAGRCMTSSWSEPQPMCRR